jgi:hypothetical protein
LGGGEFKHAAIEEPQKCAPDAANANVQVSAVPDDYPIIVDVEASG